MSIKCLCQGEAVWNAILDHLQAFSLKCGEACDPFCFSSPSVPIKAVFLQQILSWWRQPLRALEVKSHRTGMADGLCKSMCKERTEQKKETNKHKNGSLSPARSSYFLPNLRLTISKFSNFSSKNAVKPTGDQGKHISCSVEIFFAHHLPKTIENNSSTSQWKKKYWELLDLMALTSTPSWMETSFAPAFSLQRLRQRRVKAQRTVPNGSKSAFPQWITCFKKIRLDQYFSREKASFCDADERRQETCWNQWSLRLCAEVQSRSYIIQALLHQTTLLGSVFLHHLWSPVTNIPHYKATENTFVVKLLESTHSLYK